MGTTQSKPRFRRSRRFSSLRKRQGPEGANDPGPSMEERTNPWTPRCSHTNFGNTQAAPYVCIQENMSKEMDRVPDSVTKMHSALEDVGAVSCGQRPGIRPDPTNKLNTKGILSYPGLKVELPPETNHFRRCENCFKSRSLPTPASPTNKLNSTEEDQEWTITLYEIDKLSGKVPQEDLVRLMSSIYDAVDNKVLESPHGRKTVRVRLSVTPEPRQKANGVHRSSSGRRDVTLCREEPFCHHSECPKTEPTARKLHSTPFRQTPHRFQDNNKPNEVRKTQKERAMRRLCVLHDNPKCVRGSPALRKWDIERKESLNCSKTQNKEQEVFRLKSEKRPTTRESFRRNADTQKVSRTPKHEEARGLKEASKRRPRYPDKDPRNVMLRTRKKDPRFASPYDQHFQEAMYLRLRELQRQGAHEGRRATGQVGAGDEADEDSVSSDDEASQKGGPSPVPPTQSSEKEEIGVNTTNEKDPHMITTVHYHHHYHHGLPPNAEFSSLCAETTEPCSKEPPPYSHSSEAQSWATDAKHRHFHHHYHHTDKFPASS